MRLVALEFKDKWDKKYVFLAFAVQLAVLVMYNLDMIDAQDFMMSFQSAQKSVVLVFVSILFLSYEFFCDF